MYTSNFLDQKKVHREVRRAVRILKNVEFDTIAFRGMSGACVAPIIAYRLKKELVLIRKTLVGSHASFKTEGNSRTKKFVIVDDFTHSGATVKAILKEMDSFAPLSEYVGMLEYRISDWSQEELSKTYGGYRPRNITFSWR